MRKIVALIMMFVIAFCTANLEICASEVPTAKVTATLVGETIPQAGEKFSVAIRASEISSGLFVGGEAWFNWPTEVASLVDYYEDEPVVVNDDYCLGNIYNEYAGRTGKFTSVSKFNSDDGNGAVAIIMPNEDYKPLLTATVKINTWHRGVLNIYLGIQDAENPENYFEKEVSDRIYINSSGNEEIAINTIAFSGSGGNYNLSGTSETADGVVVFDFSPLLQKFEVKNNHKYYVYIKMVHSGTVYAINILNYFTLKDNHSDDFFPSEDVPIVVRNTSKEASVGATYTSGVSSVKTDKIFELKFNSKLDTNTVNSQNIKVLDDENNSLNAHFVVNGYNDIIKVSLKNGFYNNGFYAIEVDEELRSEGGNTLGNAFKHEFYVPFY